MKKFIVYFLPGMLLLPFFLSGFTPKEESNEVYVHALSGLNMRASANPSALKILSIPYGEKVRIKQISSEILELKDFGGYPVIDNWYEVEYKGRSGFVFGAYLSDFPPVTTSELGQPIGMYKYLRQHFSVLYAKVTAKSEGGNDCQHINILEGGIIEVLDQCGEHCDFSRYTFENNNVQQVLAVYQASWKNSNSKYIYSYDEKSKRIYATVDLCDLVITPLVSGGVMIEMECCGC
ncbi:MAG: SH3 domain-containing protein [Bacteroidia bacterium]|nr:SH3 domain-containing protein [Bacteroidia bacterium]